MNKTTKGALAAIGAALLLVGGAGSLAYWSDTATIAGPGTITSGQLSLTPADDTDCEWQLDGGTAFDPVNTRIVPGDTVTRNCAYTLTAVGDHLAATLDVSSVSEAGDLAPAIDVVAEVTIDDGSPITLPATDIAIDPGTHNIDATITVTFPASVEGTDYQNVTATLGDLTLTVTQSEHVPVGG